MTVAATARRNSGSKNLLVTVMRKTAMVVMVGGVAFYLAGVLATLHFAKRSVFETIVPKSGTGTMELGNARPGAAPGSGTGLADGKLQPGQIALLPVFGSDGENVGRVTGVTEGSDGKTKSILVETGGFLGLGSRTVRIRAAMLTIEADRISVALSSNEIEQLPEAGHAR